MNELLKNVLLDMSTVLWPRACIGCGREDRLTEGEVCDICWGSLVPAKGAETPKHIHQLRIAFAYDERLRKIIHHYKFHQAIVLARPLAQNMAKRLAKDGFEIPDNSILLPIPDFPARHRKRLYNPAKLLCDELANVWNLENGWKLAKRTKPGPHQSNLTHEQRKKMLKDAFIVEPNMDKERTLIIVDDVIATGTTLYRLAWAARQKGWKKIEALVLAG